MSRRSNNDNYIPLNPYHPSGAGAGGGNTSVVTDNGDGTYTHDDGTGNTVVIDASVITTTPYILAELEDSITISGEASTWRILDLEYDAAIEVNEANIVIQARIVGGAYASLILSTTWEAAINDWIIANITTEKFYLLIQLPSQTGITEWSAIIKYTEL